jgi:hypothetical protein
MPPKLERGLMFALRYVLPTVTVVGGLVVMSFGTEIDLEGGAGIVSAGLAIYFMNWLYRASIEGDKVREQEVAARDYFSAHGHWPDEAPPTARPSKVAPATRPSEASSATTIGSVAAAASPRATEPPAADALPAGPSTARPGSKPKPGRVPQRGLRPHTSSGSSRRPRGG